MYACMVKGDGGWEFLGFKDAHGAALVEHHYRNSNFKFITFLVED